MCRELFVSPHQLLHLSKGQIRLSEVFQQMCFDVRQHLFAFRLSDLDSFPAAQAGGNELIDHEKCTGALAVGQSFPIPLLQVSEDGIVSGVVFRTHQEKGIDPDGVVQFGR